MLRNTHHRQKLISLVWAFGLCVCFGGSARPAEAEESSIESFSGPLDDTMPAVRQRIVRYTEDSRLFQRQGGRRGSSLWAETRHGFLDRWSRSLEDVDFSALDQDEKIDYLLFQNHLRRELRELEHQRKQVEELETLLPFAKSIDEMGDRLRRFQWADGRQAGASLDAAAKNVEDLVKRVNAGELTASVEVARRALYRLAELRRELETWHNFYAGYDPVVTWWVEKPFANLLSQWDTYTTAVRNKLIVEPTGSEDPVVGDPIGREALLDALRFEMIPYTPEELVDIANQEFAWCETEYKKAAAELGFGDDWRGALEHVKSLHVQPGAQPDLIRQLADEAVAFLQQRDLLTIPPFCKESWRMDMMSPERQRVNPFFTGGEVISVSFPTSGMEHSDKLMTLRGNNIHFSRATVHHELIPGHHLQLYMADRHRPYRQLFRTPFFVEGWALYWEMLLWDLDFPQSAADRVGMLFWRSHRCARIIFSLQYHLGNMSADQCIDFLVDRVGHERLTATAEVRRSVEGNYEPLYQAAYMLGGLQLRALQKELVQSGQRSPRDFHDAVLRENSIPIDMIRASLMGSPLAPDYQPTWRFYPADSN